MISSSSQSPFPRSGSSRAIGAAIGRRVFTRPPFASEPVEFPQVADDGDPFISRPPEVPFDAAPGFASRVAASRSRVAVSARVVPPTLHRRDRSLYAWFESVGFLLGALSVSGACVVLVLG